MTDRSNDAPGNGLDATTSMPAADAELDATAEALTPEEVVEEAPDLSDAQLDAASDAAESQVADDDEDEAEADEAVAAAPPKRLGARERAAQAAAAKTAAAERGARAPKSATRTTFPIDPALRIKDQASAGFVLASILFFLLIFMNAMAFGRGGAFTPVRTPTPVVSPSPGPSVSPGPTGSAGPSATVAPSAVPSAAPSATNPLQ